MFKQIAIYPEELNRSVVSKWEEYTRLAVRYGINEVFSTIHLPEVDKITQIEAIEKINEIVKKYDNLVFCVDIGGSYLDEFIGRNDISNRILAMRLDFIRVDYGINIDQIRMIKECWQPKGIVLNASIYPRYEFISLVNSIRDMGLEVRACHNFYPRVETGLSKKFYLEQQEIMDELGLPVYICVANYHNPRGPVYEGLVTLEEHRNKTLEEVLLDCAYALNANGIMMADEYFEEEEFRILSNVINREELTVKVKLEAGIKDDERKALLDNCHSFRYDSNDIVLRSGSSREMSQYAKKYKPNNTKERKRLSITIDNELYKRYSGEIQIILKDLPADERVNVIGVADEADAYKLQYYRKGFKYKFVSE